MKRTKTRVGTDPKKPIVSTKRRARVWANKALSVLCAVTLVCGLVPNVALGTNTAAEQEAAAAAATAQVIETKATEAATADAQATDAQATDAQATEAQATDAQATEAQDTEAQATDAQKSVAYPARAWRIPPSPSRRSTPTVWPSTSSPPRAPFPREPPSR